jgi:hypothetical protein
MEYAGGENGISLADHQRFHKMLQVPRAAAGYDRHSYGFADGPGQLDVVSRLPSVFVPACKEPRLASMATTMH